MSSRTYSNRRESRHRMLQDRLKLIRRRHRELILKPRERILDHLAAEDEDSFHMLEDPEELQMLARYQMETQA